MTTTYQSPIAMSVHGAPATYSTGDPSHSVNYGSSPGAAQEKPTGLNAAYLISIHGILKLICLICCGVSFICVVTTWRCYGVHAFLATVTSLVIITQGTILAFNVCRWDKFFFGIGLVSLDLIVTAYEALYLVIASCITINYCRFAGPIAAGVLGILAFLSLVGHVVLTILTGRTDDQDGTKTSANR